MLARPREEVVVDVPAGDDEDQRVSEIPQIGHRRECCRCRTFRANPSRRVLADSFGDATLGNRHHPRRDFPEGFDGEANIDPRYNSLNVTAGDQIVSVEIVGAEPSDPEEQLSLEKDVARAALERV